MKRLLLACLIGLAGGGAVAQEMTTIRGTVKDATSQEAIEFATVVARKHSDSAVVQSAFTDSLGKFMMT
ncbi:MAG: carboxypeptidase-like regulatory domain-containing protein, partial [Leadbetterella sp.]|nr:carboxypeptidase-like regulatory domain-containing protein [Leadbetterella sp.]